MSDRCEHKDCGNLATVVVHWPGRTTRYCDVHRAAAERVATAMGFSLASETLLPAEGASE